MRLLLASLLLCVATCANAEDYTWVQYVDKGLVSARAITENNKCPQIIVDDKPQDMLLRASLEKIQVCEYNISLAKSAKINDQELKLPAKQINRFVVIGDTGCENSVFEPEHREQKCDAKNWPFKKVADKVAELNPDFVIHTGDYIYRNKYTKPEDKIKNSQMQWQFFKQDFFEPAKNLLSKAPMIFVRGNHESCKLTGKGWFSFLEPGKNRECIDYTPSYNLNIDDLNFIVFDSAGSKDLSKKALEQYTQYFANIYKSIDKQHWLLIHQPIIPLQKLSETESFSDKLHSLAVEKAFKEEYTKKIPLSISGHYHAMALTKRAKDNFIQVVVGNGGTKLHQTSKDNYDIISNNGEDKSSVRIRYGYVVFDRVDGDKWKMTSYDVKGNELLVMDLLTK